MYITQFVFCEQDAKDRVQYYIDHLLKREARVYEFLKDRSPLPASVSDIAQHMYWVSIVTIILS